MALASADSDAQAKTQRGLRDAKSAPQAEIAAAAPLPTIGQTFRDCEDCPEMVVIPPGRFAMGTDPAETARDGVPDEFANRERPRHPVVVKAALAVGKYHVTRGEYARFVKAAGYAGGLGCYFWSGDEVKSDPGTSWRDPSFPQTDRDPVVCVNWYDARAYAAWLARTTGKDYRLLTEAEWEYAARGGTTTSRPWGDDANAGCRYANGADLEMKKIFSNRSVAHCRDGYVFTSPAGSFEPNAFGLYDMLGNAWQWVEDCFHANYADAPGDAAIAVEGGDCSQRAVRGGSWNNSPGYIRAGVRDGVGTGNRDSFNGFRVARTF
ncbi:MAG: formylglycine-generating enzyme family protein [Proteobacteria bacterium]|nr:formylglycine-generating enzyme family protein [Pseudomonadota bacterium]